MNKSTKIIQIHPDEEGEASPPMGAEPALTGHGQVKKVSLVDMQRELDDDDQFNLTLKLKESDGLLMRNASSIRYSRKLKAKAHSIRVHDVCSSNCSRDH